ncbi:MULTISPECIES: MSCRAMM family protein [Gordonia]|uniref:Uncharacterized protein n=1 Tax=Gordonia sihwensis NBRC 108236 TaxID=1223544 RepID=L7LFH8_9ACTN|nr:MULTISPECIES: carboxypeptidase-like regulatory domain-containing protein [Gordonia]MBY4568577.1 MFS transporter permease [Gordonia sihwensis]GAC59649.1 hypothetical protein GSI01S_03_01090 [Gordonia sihwensis NBRC 108236]
MRNAVDGHSRLIRGVVRDERGGSVPDATVTVIDQQGSQVAVASARHDGSFTAHVAADGQYVLAASATGHEPAAVTAMMAGAPIQTQIVLSAHSSLGGLVRAADGAPIAGAVVTATAPSGHVVATAVAGADGRWELRGVAEGGYTLVVNAPGFEATARTVAHTAGSSQPVVVEMRSAVALSGLVTDAHGGVIGHSQVSLLAADGSMAASVFSDEDGRYSFTDLTPGDYTVLANGYAPVAATVDVRAGRFVNHEFVLGVQGR